MRQQPKARPDDGQRTVNTHQTGMREEYFEIVERGLGLLHAIVSASYCCISRILLALRLSFVNSIAQISISLNDMLASLLNLQGNLSECTHHQIGGKIKLCDWKEQK
jgi:hypothetical protein